MVVVWVSQVIQSFWVSARHLLLLYICRDLRCCPSASNLQNAHPHGGPNGHLLKLCRPVQYVSAVLGLNTHVPQQNDSVLERKQDSHSLSLHLVQESVPFCASRREQTIPKEKTYSNHYRRMVFLMDASCLCRSGRVRVLAPDGAVREYVPPATLSSEVAMPGTWTRITPSGLPLPDALNVHAGCSDASLLSASDVCCLKVCLP